MTFKNNMKSMNFEDDEKFTTFEDGDMATPLDEKKEDVIVETVEVFPWNESIIPGRWGKFDERLVPYGAVSTMLTETIELLEKIRDEMADLARNPRPGVPIRYSLFNSVDIATASTDTTASIIKQARRRTKRFYTREHEEGLRAIEDYRRQFPVQGYASAAWLDMRCARWKWSFSRRSHRDMNRLLGAYQSVLSHARYARLAAEEGYRF
ncbi:hypothetical protein ACO1O0_006860 [Amphichorda felina]